MVDVSKMLVPALIGGLVAGILSAIPIISCGNILCCMWIILGGAVSAYLLARKEKVELVDGAIVGALSGIVFAIVATVLGFIFNMLFSALGIAIGATGSEEIMGRIGIAALGGIIWYLILLFVDLVLGIIFGAIGGVIAAKLMEKK